MSAQSTTVAAKVQTCFCFSLTPAAVFNQCKWIEFQLWAFLKWGGAIDTSEKEKRSLVFNRKQKDGKYKGWGGCYMHNWVAECKKKETVQFCANPWCVAALHGAPCIHLELLIVQRPDMPSLDGSSRWTAIQRAHTCLSASPATLFKYYRGLSRSTWLSNATQSCNLLWFALHPLNSHELQNKYTSSLD